MAAEDGGHGDTSRSHVRLTVRAASHISRHLHTQVSLPLGLPSGRPRTGVTQNRLDFAMKIRNSIKSLRKRHRDNRVVRRRGRLYVINKTMRRFKARQG